MQKQKLQNLVGNLAENRVSIGQGRELRLKNNN